MPSGRQPPPGASSDATGAGVITATAVGVQGAVEGTVKDLSLTDVSVVTSLEAKDRLAIGEPIALTLRFGDERSVLLQAHLRTEAQQSDALRLGFAFADPAAIRAKLPAGLMRAFNERSTFRVEPDAPIPIDVEIIDPAFEASGQLHDLSADGLSFRVPDEPDERLTPGVAAIVDFTLPGHARPQSLPVTVRSRRGLGDDGGVIIGARFDHDPSPQFAAHRKAVTEYVMSRQRAWLKSRAGR